jgi:hypothetical protein
MAVAPSTMLKTPATSSQMAANIDHPVNRSGRS